MNNNNKKPDPEAIKHEMMTYLEEKYGQEFVPLSFEYSGFAYSNDTMRAYPKDGDKEDAFEVWGTRMNDGSYRMQDGYFGIYIRPQYSEFLSKITGELYEDFKYTLSFGEGVQPDRLNKDTKLEEIYDPNEPFKADVVIFVKEASADGIDTDESLNTIAANMIEKKLVANIRIYIVRNDKFDSITADALNAKDEKEYFLDDYKIIMIGKNLEIL